MNIQSVWFDRQSLLVLGVLARTRLLVVLVDMLRRHATAKLASAWKSFSVT